MLTLHSSLCKLVYHRRITDVTSDDAKHVDSTPAHVPAPDAPNSAASINSPPKPNRPIIHPVPPSRPNKRKREDDPDEDPSNYRRVILKTRKRRKLHDNSPEGQLTEKRKLGDAMDIDSDLGSPKRLRHEAQSDISESETDDRVTKKEEVDKAPGLDEWEHTPKDFDFNPYSGKAPEGSQSWMKYYDNLSKPRLQDSPCVEKVDQIPVYEEESLLKGSMGVRKETSRAHKTNSMTQPVTKPTKSQTSPRKATEEDARKAGIPAGYSYKNWDPTEEPIMLLGSVFDANSLGKWIYDWAVYHYGPATPLSDMAGELWLLLIQLAGKVKRAEEIEPKIYNQNNKEMVEDFMEAAERLWEKFAKLLKVCEDYMWKAAQAESGNKKPVSMGKNSGFEFVDSIFGKDRELEKTEKLMTGIRVWSMRFDYNCEEILRNPSKLSSVW
jgi:hypothetical protein